MNAVVVVLLGLVLTAGAVRPETEINLDGPVSMLPTPEEMQWMKDPAYLKIMGIEEYGEITLTIAPTTEFKGWKSNNEDLEDQNSEEASYTLVVEPSTEEFIGRLRWLKIYARIISQE